MLTPSWTQHHRRFECFKKCLDAYEEMHPAGGSLHIYLEDMNNTNDDVQFCRKYAEEKGDWLGVYLCEELLYYGDQFIAELIDVDIHVAFDSWMRAKEREEKPNVDGRERLRQETVQPR